VSRHLHGYLLPTNALGLNKVYILNNETGKVVRFGKTGKRDGSFKDVAGISVDKKGDMIIADAGNNRENMIEQGIFSNLSSVKACKCTTRIAATWAW